MGISSVSNILFCAPLFGYPVTSLQLRVMGTAGLLFFVALKTGSSLGYTETFYVNKITNFVALFVHLMAPRSGPAVR